MNRKEREVGGDCGGGGGGGGMSESEKLTWQIFCMQGSG